VAKLSKLIDATAKPFSFQPAPVAGGGKELAVDIPHQEEEWWCWCAVAVGVDAYYRKAAPMAQCRAAGLVLHNANACLERESDAVNCMVALDDALSKFGNFAGAAGPVDFKQVKVEIDAGRPVGVRIEFTDFAVGHFLVIRGYSEPGRMLVIDDPYEKDGAGDVQTIPYSTLVSGYKSGSIWTDTYFTDA
jgi:peptidase C39-like protein